MTETIISESGKTYEHYQRENEQERIVMLTDTNGVQHVKRMPRSFTFAEITEELIEEIES